MLTKTDTLSCLTVNLSRDSPPVNPVLVHARSHQNSDDMSFSFLCVSRFQLLKPPANFLFHIVTLFYGPLY